MKRTSSELPHPFITNLAESGFQADITKLLKLLLEEQIISSIPEDEEEIVELVNYVMEHLNLDTGEFAWGEGAWG